MAKISDLKEGSKTLLDSLRFRIEREGKWGAIDGNGRIVIEPRFTSISDFDHTTGLAVAAVWFPPKKAEPGDKFEADDFYGVINRDGQWIIAPAFDHLEDFDPVSGLAVARRTQDANNTQELKLGLISPDGEWRIRRQFSEVKPFHPASKLAPARLTFDWGLMDVSGNWAVAPAFEDITPFDDQTSLFWACKNGSWGLLRPDGSWMVTPMFGRWEPASHGSGIAWAKEGRAYDSAIDTASSRLRVTTGFGGSGSWHIVRSDGAHFACPEINGPFPGGGFKNKMSCCVARCDDGRRGILNREGRWVLPPRHGKLTEFREDLSIVLAEEGGRWGWLDLAGSWVLPPNYETLTLPHLQFGTAWAKRDGSWHLLDSKGDVQRTLPFIISARPYSSETGFVAQLLQSGEKKTGWMGWDGNWVVAPEYASLMLLQEEPTILLASLESEQEGILLAPQTWLVPPEKFAPSHKNCDTVNQCAVDHFGGQWIRITAYSSFSAERIRAYYINLRTMEVVLAWDGTCRQSLTTSDLLLQSQSQTSAL